jgi:maltose O-acetyltransferase
MDAATGVETNFAPIGPQLPSGSVSIPVKNSNSEDAAVSGLVGRSLNATAREFSGIEVRKLLLHCVATLLPRHAFPLLRAQLYRCFGVRIGKSTLLAGALELFGPRGCISRLTIGNLCYLNSDILFDLNSEVSIGDEVSVGHHVRFLTSSHAIGPPNRRCGPQSQAAIRVGHGCWIGSGAVLLPGINVGNGSVIAAGAVVTRDVPANSIVGGVPARLIRQLPGEGCTDDTESTTT